VAKLVLGIVVVFCLNLAFILFIRSGGDLVELAQAISIPPADSTLVSQAFEVPEQETQNKTPSEDIYRFPVPKTVSVVNFQRKAIPSRVRSVERGEVARKVRSQPLRPYAVDKTVEPFADTVIWIERASYAPYHQSGRVENPPMRTTKSPVTAFAQRKRSPFRRIGTVAKKPYDWIKAFATKLF
jgi:hypothetical protein